MAKHTIKLYKLRGDISPRIAKAIYLDGIMAVDIEMDRGIDWRVNKIGLVQIYSPSVGAVLIRTNRGQVPKRVIELLNDSEVIKIFHFAFGDLCFLAHHWGVKAQNVICTKIAEKILVKNSAAPLSLKDLLPKYLALPVDKSEQLSDWFAPQLTPDQEYYAANDVLHLIDLWRKIRKALVESHKLGLAMELFDALPALVQLETQGYNEVYSGFARIFQYK